MHSLDGSGVYRHDAILGPFDKPADTSEVFVPQIEEIRLIRGPGGEDYVNVNDLGKMMKILAYKFFSSLSSFLLIKAVINNLKPQGGDHD